MESRVTDNETSLVSKEAHSAPNTVVASPNKSTSHLPIKEYLEIEDQLWRALDQLAKRLPKGHPNRLPSKYEKDSIGFLGFDGLFDGRFWLE